MILSQGTNFSVARHKPHCCKAWSNTFARHKQINVNAQSLLKIRHYLQLSLVRSCKCAKISQFKVAHSSINLRGVINFQCTIVTLRSVDKRTKGINRSSCWAALVVKRWCDVWIDQSGNGFVSGWLPMQQSNNRVTLSCHITIIEEIVSSFFFYSCLELTLFDTFPNCDNIRRKQSVFLLVSTVCMFRKVHILT